MLVPFDNGTPRTLARYLIDHHAVTEARARGWDILENGALLDAAEAAGFDVLVTTDKNLSYQQNLSARKLGLRPLFCRCGEAPEIHIRCRGKINEGRPHRDCLAELLWIDLVERVVRGVMGVEVI